MYRYTLDPSSKKYACPQCGKKTLVAYLDTATNEPVDVYEYGRCDREGKCAYHLSPYSNDELRAQAKPENYTPPPPPVIVQLFPEESVWKPIIERTKSCVSPFHQWANKLTVPNEHLLKCGVYSEEELTVFVFRNIGGQICNLKWFKYKADGHRDKDFNAYSLKNPKTSPHPTTKKTLGKISDQQLGAETKKFQMCLFMEHLLDPEKKRPVCVVESEKTAAIASFFYKDYDWVACGSASGLSDGTNGTPDKVTPLKGRKVIWLADADKAGRGQYDKLGEWRFPSSVRHLIAAIDDFQIFDLFRERVDGYDIGDAIADGLRPVIKDDQPWVKGSDNNKPLMTKDQQMGYLYELPDGVEFETVKEDIFKYMQFEHDGKIWIVRKRKGEQDVPYYCQDITNFTIKSLGLINSLLNPRRIVEIKNIHHHTRVLQVPTKAFASATEFTVFIESEGNYQYDGIGTDLKKVRAKLYDTMPAFEEVETLGWHHAGYMIFANGVYSTGFHKIDKYGFVKMGERNFFIEPLSCITQDNNEDWEDEKKFIYKKRDDVKMKEWAALFCRVHKDNGMMMMAWYITGLFRDLIYQRFKFFPHTFLFGPPGTGKSQLGWSIRALSFSGIKKPFNLSGGTKVAFHRELSHFINVPCWFDEYDNAIDYDRVQSLKAAYDGAGHKKSVKDSDKRTKTVPVVSPVMISGQQLPIADVALFKRVILLQFHQTEYTEKEKELFSQLQTMEDGGLSFITAALTTLRPIIEEQYVVEFEKVLQEMVDEAATMQFDVEDRILRNSALCLTTIKVLAHKIGESLPFDYARLKAVLMENVKEQMALILNANETNTFWDMVEYMIDQKLILEGEDYIFDFAKQVTITVGRETAHKQFERSTEMVFMRFSKIIPLYKENFRRQNGGNAAPMDKGSLIHYLQHSKAYIGLVGSKQFKSSKTSCYCFDYSVLRDSGINLVRGAGGDTPPPPPPDNNTPPEGPGGKDDLPF